MNRSGQSAVQLAHKLKISPIDIIIIHDDLDLPLGSIRIRQGGGDGGHKGVKSIIDDLGSSDFIRVRIGISRPPNTDGSDQPDISDYVLSAFTPDEEEIIKKTVATASAAIDYLLEQDLEKVMGRYNKSIVNPEVEGI
jgi:PTH1 family peptidyl-tRNA hydrolase